MGDAKRRLPVVPGSLPSQAGDAVHVRERRTVNRGAGNLADRVAFPGKRLSPGRRYVAALGALPAHTR